MKEIALNTLKPGQRFSIELFTTGRIIRGELIRVNLCSATVKIDGNGSTKKFSRLNRKTGEYQDVTVAAQPTVEHWQPETLVRFEADSPARPNGPESEHQLGLAFHDSDSLSADAHS
jgi:hypothetical protein